MSNKKTLIVVDDDRDDRLLIKLAMDEKNYAIPVEFLEDGAEFLDFLAKKNETNTLMHPNTIVLLDLNMPKIDGREVLRKMQENENWKKIPVIVFSTSSAATDINLCYELGASSYVIKPSDFDELTKFMSDFHDYWITHVKLSA